MSTWPEQLAFPGAEVLHHYLSPEGKDTFTLEDAAWPNVQSHSTLPLHVVQVCAVAIHRDELELTEEERNGPIPVRKIPGYEFSGYVVSAAPDSPLSPGTERFGNARTFTVARLHNMAAKPKSMTWEQSATVPIGFVTAYSALFRWGLLREPGDGEWGWPKWDAGWNVWTSLLITGAATPVGVWAIQLARLARVGRIAATCDAKDMDLKTEEGSLRKWDQPGFSAVLDLMGGETLTRTWRLVAADGKIISLAENADEAKPDLVEPRIKHAPNIAMMRKSGWMLKLCARLADRGLLQPVCDPEDVFEIGYYDKALEKLRNHTRGQVVLQVDPEPPLQLIKDLDLYGDKSLLRQADFNDKNIEQASLADEPLEAFEFSRWLLTAGSNDPSLPQTMVLRKTKSSETKDQDSLKRPLGYMSADKTCADAYGGGDDNIEKRPGQNAHEAGETIAQQHCRPPDASVPTRRPSDGVAALSLSKKY
ncbi:uncharacterized protein B0T15DRAFT_573020 [Chaetomium strumarium]|uniref:Enoyl reductase (ER) domain-containing protein n=1 Tax=Chaetomium strumarium TaxID=1170767 RepID=A0AAJ0GZC4_9PEZI|nr:hypothetical protein B0T15DRAFT_573020 [Chaetomium strumarium]